MMDSVVNVDWTGKMMVYSSSEYLPVRSLAHKVKEGNPEGISKAAGILAGIIKEIPDYQNKVLVPMPGHDGWSASATAASRSVCSTSAARAVAARLVF